MRWSWFLLFIVAFLGGTLAAAETATTPATETVSEAAPVTTTTSTEEPAPAKDGKYTTHRLANELVEVIISDLKGSIRSMSLLQEKPVLYREWQRRALIEQGHQPPNPDEPLAILDDFNKGAGKHNWIDGIGLPKSNPAWTLISSDEENVVLGYTNEANKITYRLAYHLPKGALALRSSLTVENHGDADFNILPHIYPLNGVHQDDLKQDKAYLAFVYHAGEPSRKIQSLSLPPIAGPATEVPADQLNYVCLKSRFFGALWHPQLFRISDINEKAIETAPAPAEAGGPNTEAGGPGAEAGGPGSQKNIVAAGPRGNFQVYGHGYLDRNQAHQAYVDVAYYGPASGDITIKPQQKMDIAWTLTVASMKKAHLEIIGDLAAKVEYSDGYYRFFGSLAWLITVSLDALILVVVNYGLAVVVLTFLIKLLLHRTTFKQHESMMKMQKLAPDLKLLQETYKNDKQKLAQKQMELWKKHGVNPLGGCLPILIQIPIFTALYLAFCHSADMRGHGFLWVNDLTLPDQLIGFMVSGWTISINPLPLIYIAVSVWMSLMQKMPEGGDPQQAQMMKMMRWLPVVFGIIFYNFPSGLVLYFTVNAVLSTIEIKMVRRKLGMT